MEHIHRYSVNTLGVGLKRQRWINFFGFGSGGKSTQLYTDLVKYLIMNGNKSFATLSNNPWNAMLCSEDARFRAA